MKFHSLIPLIKRFSRRFFYREILDWFYIGVILCLIGGMIMISISTLTFLLHAFDTAIFASDEKILNETPSFNITGLKMFGPRFGITIRDIPTSSIAPK